MILALLKSVVWRHRVRGVVLPEGGCPQGGPTGVANSVNAAVVESILVLMVVNVAIGQLYIMLFPGWGSEMTASTVRPIPDPRTAAAALQTCRTTRSSRIGHMFAFFVRAVMGIPIVLKNYRARVRPPALRHRLGQRLIGGPVAVPPAITIVLGL